MLLSGLSQYLLIIVSSFNYCFIFYFLFFAPAHSRSHALAPVRKILPGTRATVRYATAPPAAAKRTAAWGSATS